MAKKSKKTAVKKTKVVSKAKATARKTTSKTKTVKAAASASKTLGKATSPKLKSTPRESVKASDSRVIEYKLFTEDSVRNLEDQVNYHIKKGWAPVGGVVLHGQSTFTQTMVRHES